MLIKCNNVSNPLVQKLRSIIRNTPEGSPQHAEAFADLRRLTSFTTDGNNNNIVEELSKKYGKSIDIENKPTVKPNNITTPNTTLKPSPMWRRMLVPGVAVAGAIGTGAYLYNKYRNANSSQHVKVAEDFSFSKLFSKYATIDVGKKLYDKYRYKNN